ncbi:glutathione S-transferase family protein [Paracoccus sp. Z330]|uniref:Glutathione S-transferase family protein n=1 Tax=Paracoccus onchidii TaxID=3017813 RepID=A0ABT4ZDX6_9RHOB|nr:glutathione S-transferase family protein [Paracoccus onchidii]MDB6177558.1 glutathione S-transferase family protein [Paracoccus onchidii]
MADITITTFDWVPNVPRGYVRDIRLRWALEEVGLPYRVESTPFKDRGDEHFENQPFGQVPWLTHGDISIFESGADLLYLAETSGKLLPADPKGRSEVIMWLFAGLNSVEMAVLPFTIFKFSGDEEETPGRQALDGFLSARLGHVEAYLSGRNWLCDDFSIADIIMSDVLRLADRFDALSNYPNCRSYVERAVSRPAFKKAYQDQLDHFAKAD